MRLEFRGYSLCMHDHEQGLRTDSRMILPPLYHWSPQEHRAKILQHGLQIMREDQKAKEDGFHGVRWPWVCLGSTPLQAWDLLPWFGEELAGMEFDLYEVKLQETDDVHIRCDFGPVVREVRVHNSIPADRVFWVARRNEHAGLDVQPVDEWDDV